MTPSRYSHPSYQLRSPIPAPFCSHCGRSSSKAATPNTGAARRRSPPRCTAKKPRHYLALRLFRGPPRRRRAGAALPCGSRAEPRTAEGTNAEGGSAQRRSSRCGHCQPCATNRRPAVFFSSRYFVTGKRIRYSPRSTTPHSSEPWGNGNAEGSAQKAIPTRLSSPSAGRPHGAALRNAAAGSAERRAQSTERELRQPRPRQPPHRPRAVSLTAMAISRPPRGRRSAPPASLRALSARSNPTRGHRRSGGAAPRSASRPGPSRRARPPASAPREPRAAVLPSLTAVEPFFTASWAYSTWKRCPSGEKTVMARS